MMKLVDLETILARVRYRDWRFHSRNCEGGFLLWVEFAEEEGPSWTGRKWWVSRHSTNSEVVQTCLKAVLTAEEHEARERFRYFNVPVYGPHLDVDALLEVADRLDRRPAAGAPSEAAIREQLREEGFDVAPYRGANDVCLRVREEAPACLNTTGLRALAPPVASS